MPVTSSEFQWPKKVGPSSRVIRPPYDAFDDKCWQENSILVPHEALRWMDSRIKEMIARVDGKEAWRVTLFTGWLRDRYLDFIHHHHDAEEQTYNPAIVAAGGDIGKSIVPQHQALMAGIAKATELCNAVDAEVGRRVGVKVSPVDAEVEAGTGSTTALQNLKQHLLAFIKDMEDHLAEEEVIYPKAIRQAGMTQKEEAAVVEKIIQGLGLDGNKKFLPVIVYAMCEWGGEDYMQHWLLNGGPPPPIRFALQKCWLHDFYVNNLGVINAITSSDTEYVPETPQCSICTIQ